MPESLPSPGPATDPDTLLAELRERAGHNQGRDRGVMLRAADEVERLTRERDVLAAVVERVWKLATALVDRGAAWDGNEQGVGEDVLAALSPPGQPDTEARRG
jgi:hypothetical protein